MTDLDGISSSQSADTKQNKSQSRLFRVNFTF